MKISECGNSRSIRGIFDGALSELSCFFVAGGFWLICLGLVGLGWGLNLVNECMLGRGGGIWERGKGG